MFVRISNTPRDYAWGSTTAIAELVGREPSGSPEAELWLGAHAGSPSVILEPSKVGGARTLAEWIERDPETALGADAARGSGRPRLPFLLKILAATANLSLQAHPTPAQAAAGFARENALGIPLGAADRSYKDAFHKPEMIYALSDTFEALCGFRPIAESVRLVDVLAQSASRGDADALDGLRGRLTADGDEVDVLRGVVSWILGRGSSARELIDVVVRRVGTISDGATTEFAREIVTTQRLSEAHPGDPGIVLSLLLNRVTLKRGEALYLPAGNIHAYLSGLGVELMAASDNVLRGGLTPKHIDVPELLDVLDFRTGAVRLLVPEYPTGGVEVFRPAVSEFQLVRAQVGPANLTVEVTIVGPAIAFCADGAISLTGNRSSVGLERGQSVYVTPQETAVIATGVGTLFVATTNWV